MTFGGLLVIWGGLSVIHTSVTDPFSMELRALCMKESQIVLPIRVNISGKQIKIFFYRFFHASIVWPYFDNSVNTK
jgi:hypothetical protein